MSMQTSSPAASKASIVKGFLGVVHLQALLVLVQAIIAGQFLYGSWSITSHGVLGNISFILAVTAVVLALVGKLPKGLLVLSAVIVVLMVAQIGLGYSTTDENQTPASWHIPLGVTIFGAVVYQVAVATRRLGRRATE